MDLVGINLRERPEVVTGFVREKAVSYATVLDATGEVAGQYGVRGIPDIVLVDKEGLIRYRGHQLPSVDEVERVL